ncbi:MAG: ferrochelatase [Phycisphaerales bacterium]|nr:MAG: ferrochelatase [Phycisphaerales bacterium]
MSATPNHPHNGRATKNGSSSPSGCRRAVLLLNVGTPDHCDTSSVRRYLAQFLADPEVIRLPRRLRWMNRPLGRVIALSRAGKSAELYRRIWTDRGSPLKVITEDQVEALSEALPGGWRVFFAMRYSRPSVVETLEAIVEAGIDDLVVIPMYPQFSGPTTGTALRELYSQLGRLGRQLNVTVRNTWFDDAGYIEAQAALIRDFALAHDLHPANSLLLFSAHSMPQSYVQRGDPYQAHVKRTVELVTRRLGWSADRMVLSYQSRLGPVAWLEPSTEATIRRLAEEGERKLLVCPISFTADCLETLEEIGMGYRRDFESAGGELHLCPALNSSELFIKSLATLALRGPKPILNGHSAPSMLVTPAPAETEDDFDIRRLVMIGVSLPGRLGLNHGPSLRHVDRDQLKCVKKPHEEVAELLRKLADSDTFSECWLWNTCNRFEFYGWLALDPRSGEADQALARAAHRVIGAQVDELPVNILHGEDARLHLQRTAAGLNSGLPGDADVAGQLRIAERIAERCHTAGPRMRRILDEVLTTQEDMRRHTSWGRLRQEYCGVALRGVEPFLTLPWPEANCVIIGGSATASSVLHTLRDQCIVPERQLTVVYRSRCKGAQLKRLRKAVGNGTRLRVDNYDDKRVIEAISQADVVFFTSDSRTPILDAAQIRSARDFTERSLVAVDFNTFGSTKNLESITGVCLVDARSLEEEVAGFSDALCDCPAFTDAAIMAATWIHRRLNAEEPDSACGPEKYSNGHCRACRTACELRDILFKDSIPERTAS